jgi:hypothetical protein
VVDTFRTSDYGQAAFFLALEFTLERTERSGQDVIFHFHSSPALLEAISQYSSNGPVPCRDFFHALRRTKGMIRRDTENTDGRSPRQPHR